MRVSQLILAEKKTERRIKVRMKEKDEGLVMGLLGKYFRVVHAEELKK